MEITIINKTDGSVRAHRAGCRDIAREARGNNDSFVLGTFTSEDEVVTNYNADFDKDTDGWYDIDFAPCAKF